METKFVDSTTTSQNITGSWALIHPDNPAGSVNSLTPISEGDGEQDRDGRKCIIKSLFIHGIVVWPTGTAADEIGPVRMALVQDMQTNGANFTPSNVFKTPATGNALNAFRDLQYTSRFKILHERYVHPPVQTGGAGGNGTTNFTHGGQVAWKMYVPKLDMKQTWSGTGNTVS